MEKEKPKGEVRRAKDKKMYWHTFRPGEKGYEGDEGPVEEKEEELPVEGKEEEKPEKPAEKPKSEKKKKGLGGLL